MTKRRDFLTLRHQGDISLVLDVAAVLAGVAGNGVTLRDGTLAAVESTGKGALATGSVGVARDDTGILVPAGRAGGTSARVGRLSTLVAGVGADGGLGSLGGLDLIVVGLVGKDVGVGAWFVVSREQCK